MENIIELIKWITPVGTMYLGFVLGLKKYRREKLWEAKYQAYMEIIKSMNTIQLFYGENYKSLASLPSIGNEKLQELEKEQNMALLNLRIHVNTGSIIMSKKVSSLASDILHMIDEELFQYEDKLTYTEQNSNEGTSLVADHSNVIKKIIEKELPEVLKSMKEDLA